jgi:hypothetical protein
MKKIIPVLIFFIFHASSSQIRVGDFKISQYGFSKLSKKDVHTFKNKTTYFAIDEELLIYKEEFKSVLDQIWTITPYKIINNKGICENMSEENSYVRFNSFSITRESKLTTSTSSFFIFDFFVPDKLKHKKNGKCNWKPKRVGAMYFTPDVSGRKDIVAQKKNIGGDLLNYRLGYIKNGFQTLHKSIENMESREMYDDIINKDKLGVLKKKTLYFSRNFIYGYNAFRIK